MALEILYPSAFSSTGCLGLLYSGCPISESDSWMVTLPSKKPVLYMKIKEIEGDGFDWECWHEMCHEISYDIPSKSTLYFFASRCAFWW